MLYPLAVSKEKSFFDAFDVGLRFYFPNNKTAQAYRSVRFRVFVSDALRQDMQLQAHLAPYALTDPKLTHLTVIQRQAAGLSLASYYRTHIGHSVYLTTTDTSGFCFQANPTVNQIGALTMVPAGAYGLRMVPEEAIPGLLCGVAGTEYLLLPDSRSGAKLVFHPGQAAYIPGYHPQNNPAARAKHTQTLDSECKTAWVSLSSEQDIAYYAQPETASLYELEKKANVEAMHYYNFLPLQAAKLTGNSEVLFPMVPFAGVAGDPKIAQALEVGTLSPERRVRFIPGTDLPQSGPANLTPSMQVLPGDPPLRTTRAVTPQGWLATFETTESAESNWTFLDLARVQPPYGSGQLRLQDIKPPLRTALLTSQQCIVASDAAAFSHYLKDFASIHIGDWEFNISPEAWDRHNTIIILKNSKQSLAELAANPAAWSAGQEFNKDPSGISRTILSIIERAREAEKCLARLEATGQQPGSAVGTANSDFKNFLEVIDAPEWNGLLVLNAHVSLEALPQSLQGLAAGIDAKSFFAHHLGIPQTPFIDEKKEPSSSIFALISYAAESASPEPRGDYAFTVRSLKILFQNSVIRDFSSKITLAVGRMFGAAAVSNDSTTPVMEFNGVYQQKGDGDSYAFNLVTPAVVTLQDKVLPEVEIKQGSFFTTVDPAQHENGSDMVQAGFAFSGQLHFADISQYDAQWFDLFSYDTLDYTDLRLDFSFKANQPASIVFSFNPNEMRLLLESSRVRNDSFAAHFPVRAAGVLNGTSGGPKQAGFTTVGLPFPFDDFSGSWYGLATDLQVGVINDTGAANGVKAQLVWAWVPGSGKPKFMVGLKLPGGNGNREISIYGVLKAQIYSIELRGRNNSYALMLNGVNLKVFGQTLPPTGSFDFYLFGNPGDKSAPDQLGWYGAYKKKEDDEASAPSTKSQLT